MTKAKVYIEKGNSIWTELKVKMQSKLWLNNFAFLFCLACGYVVPKLKKKVIYIMFWKQCSAEFSNTNICSSLNW